MFFVVVLNLVLDFVFHFLCIWIVLHSAGDFANTFLRLLCGLSEFLGHLVLDLGCKRTVLEFLVN